MSKLFSSHKRFIGLGLMSTLVIALAVLGTLWGFNQRASAQADVTLVHVEPDGTDFTGNPYCPSGGPAWDDCNNITSQNHVIRTDGYVGVGDDDGDTLVDEDPTADTVDDDGDTVDGEDGDLITRNWLIQNSGANAAIVDQGLCSTLDLVTDRLGWWDDDGDGLIDEDTGEASPCVGGVPPAGSDDDDCDYIAPVGPAETACNGLDDDADTVVDDGACFDEDKPDNRDNDGDQLEGGGQGQPGGNQCSNALDDDGDTDVDLDDSDCTDPTNPGVDEDPADDDGDGLVDEDPVGTPRDEEYCVVIHSILAGETVVSLTYDGTPGGTVVKEWDSLVDTVILKDEDFGSDGRPLDADGDGNKYDADDEHLLNRDGETQDHPTVFDEALKRVRSPEPVHIVEIVHGEHEVVLDGVDDTETLHHPTQGAVIKVTIDSPGCTYFTDETGALNFGTAMNGVSDAEGRFVGPKVLPHSVQPSDVKIADVDNDGDTEVDEDPNGDEDGDTVLDDDGDTLVDEDGPDSHNGTSPSSEVDYNLRDIYLDTVCEEQATIHIKVGYPAPVGSLKLAPEEEITINWTTIQMAKQPQIRWAGEQIVLAKRWALPDSPYYPNEICGEDEDEFCPVCPLAGNPVQYNREEPSPGGLEEGVPNIGGPLASFPDRVVTFADEECISRAVYESEEPGQVDVKALMWETTYASVFRSGVNACIADYYVQGRLPDYDQDGKVLKDDDDLALCIEIVKDGYALGVGAQPTGSIINKHAFLVWYLKIYQVKLTNVDGERADHNAGDWSFGAGEDTEEDTLNVSADTLLRVKVTGWFPSADCGGHGDVCVDLDGDGNEGEGDEASEPGAPYDAVSHEGCADADDLLLPDGYCILPDDMAKLAGPHPDRLATWDVMSEPDVAASDLIGPKSSLDSHDAFGRSWVPCRQYDEDEGDVACSPARKTIDPDGAITEADALMPPLKIRAAISDVEGEDAGFLKMAMKSTDVGIDSAYQSIFIPADPEIPAMVNNGGYDWISWGPNAWMFDYPFYQYLTKTTVTDELQNELIRDFHFYTDNRGEGYFFANGDYNLSYDGCRTDAVSGAPDCSSGDVVGESNITVIGDYPYFRKHPAVESNQVIKTWTWGGDKRVTAERVDATHTAIIAHLKDRDGYCKYDVDYPDVTTSPSLHPVQGEEIEFIVNTGVGSILYVSANGEYNPLPPHDPLTDATVVDAQDGYLNAGKDNAVALAEDVRVLAGLEDEGLVDVGARAAIDEDECQAWVLIEHPLGAELDVSVIFDDPEGPITRHWPPSELLVNLVGGPSEQQMPPLWNDVCYVDDEATVEEAMADFIDDVLAVYRLKADQTWDRYFPGRCDEAEDLCSLESLGASDDYDQLFILMANSATWVQLISAPPVNVGLVPAWNSVCYAGNDKTADEATSDISSAFEIMYKLGADQAWRRYIPDRPDLDTLTTLHQFDSVILLVTAEGPITWRFDP